jgi:hypothetical protein
MLNENDPLKQIRERQEKTYVEMNAGFQERMQQDEQRRCNLELERIQKITGSGLSEDAYAVLETMLMVQRAPGQDFYQPSLNQLGFSNTIDAMGQADRLFQTLQKKGCFQTVERSGNEHLTLKGPNIHRLRIELRKLKQLEQSDLERFFRRISYGFIGANQVLSIAVAIVAIISGIFSIRATIQNQELKSVREDLNILQIDVQKLQQK